MCDYCAREWCNGECQKIDYGDCDCGRQNCSGCLRPKLQTTQKTEKEEIAELKKKVASLESKVSKKQW